MTSSSTHPVLSANIVTADSADAAALKAARGAGVQIRELDAMEQFDEAIELCTSIWRPSKPLATRELLRAIMKSGGYIVGAYDDAQLVGTSFGFFSAPGSRSLHSHVAGVSGRVRGRGVGFALKAHQRAWALAREVTSILWTFDPLVKRNAYFNLHRLRAEPIEYLLDFYGSMSDELNTSDSSDRLLVSWDLLAPEVGNAVVRAALPNPRLVLRGAEPPTIGVGISQAQRPVPGSLEGKTTLIAIPDDIEGIRVRDPALAAQWRVVVRDSLGALMCAGGATVLFDRHLGYIVASP